MIILTMNIVEKYLLVRQSVLIKNAPHMAIYKMASLVISAQEEHAGSPCSQAIAAFEPRDDFGISIRAGGALNGGGHLSPRACSPHYPCGSGSQRGVASRIQSPP